MSLIVSQLLYIQEDPETFNAEAGTDSSTPVTEYGPLDCYMHAGTEIVFDDNGDIVSGDATNEGTAE